jgi:hypothetical protein
MNERILELAEQASHQSPDGYPVTIPYSKDFAEKFAELIVKECMGMATELEAQYFNNRKEQTDLKMKKIYTEGEAACDILRFKMKQHFGVEE